jgi:hypothetical protein
MLSRPSGALVGQGLLLAPRLTPWATFCRPSGAREEGGSLAPRLAPWATFCRPCGARERDSPTPALGSRDYWITAKLTAVFAFALEGRKRLAQGVSPGTQGTAISSQPRRGGRTEAGVFYLSVAPPGLGKKGVLSPHGLRRGLHFVAPPGLGKKGVLSPHGLRRGLCSHVPPGLRQEGVLSSHALWRGLHFVVPPGLRQGVLSLVPHLTA